MRRIDSRKAMRIALWSLLSGLICLISVPGCARAQQSDTGSSTEMVTTSTPGIDFKFDFGTDRPAPGYTPVLPDVLYSPDRGYGFEEKGSISARDVGDNDSPADDCCYSDTPFYFSVKIPEGNYRVRLTLGDISNASDTTVKAELRRLMLETVRTGSGETVTKEIVVNVRTPLLPDGGRVRLKERENTSEIWAWDEKLTLEFAGSHPSVCAIEITRAGKIPTVFLLGDSTVCDQPLGPWSSWGQMLTRFLKPDIAVANHAESGESLKGALGAGRVKKVLSVLKPGDYVMVQFGHNDMKDRSADASDTYKKNLKTLVANVRAKGATPVLVTSMERKSGVKNDTLKDYPAKMREIAQEDRVSLIDLHAMSRILYRALGDDLDKAFQDGTHHNGYGSYELAKCVVQGIRDSELDLARYIVDDFQGFDPRTPDAVDAFAVP